MLGLALLTMTLVMLLSFFSVSRDVDAGAVLCVFSSRKNHSHSVASRAFTGCFSALLKPRLF